jgi:hypothetical protein
MPLPKQVPKYPAADYTLQYTAEDVANVAIVVEGALRMVVARPSEFVANLLDLRTPTGKLHHCRAQAGNHHRSGKITTDYSASDLSRLLEEPIACASTRGSDQLWSCCDLYGA